MSDNADPETLEIKCPKGHKVCKCKKTSSKKKAPKIYKVKDLDGVY